MRVPNQLPDFPVSSTTFPGKLWRLVNNNLFRSIQWSPEGTSIVINSGLFKSEVLSGGEYGVFKTTNFTSFVRQLNLYGFRKTNICSKSAGGEAAEIHYFQHTFFIRNRSDLLCNVRRSSTTKRRSYDEYEAYHQPLIGINQHARHGAIYSLLMTDDNDSTCYPPYPYYLNNNNSNRTPLNQHLQTHCQVSHQVRSSRYSPYPVHNSSTSHQLISVNRHKDQVSASCDINRQDGTAVGFSSLEDTLELTAFLSSNGIGLPGFQGKSNVAATSIFSPALTNRPTTTNYTGPPTERRERIQRRFVVQEDIQTLCSPAIQDTNKLPPFSGIMRTSETPSLRPSVNNNYTLPAAPFIHQRYKLEHSTNCASQSNDNSQSTISEPSQSVGVTK
ncbi:heat shock transcription factor-like isoform X2 [Anneissia japonica]|uniref:heat shock transcription factor-like isoform X2 n=1 Tax=Anneissia japonica TaxID=1529436 RepID=UPI0014259850|nr:heat shock transcription factor-like isoform X2 [Anneissia japonica]